MVKLLLKKQLSEIFRSYFYDAKKNKPRSKASTVSLIVLYVLLMVGVIGGMFTLFSIGLCAPLHEAGLDWLYFTLFALVGVLMGVFGSVFNTFSGLYQAKDNDLLLSLPIPVRAILASRLLGVYLMGLMFSGVILLPCVIVYWAVGVLTAATVLGGIALILAVSLLVLVLSCLLGGSQDPQQAQAQEPPYHPDRAGVLCPVLHGVLPCQRTDRAADAAPE